MDRPKDIGSRLWERCDGCPTTHLSQFCTVRTGHDGAVWTVEAVEDGLERLSFDLTNEEALNLARRILQANGYGEQADMLPSEGELA